MKRQSEGKSQVTKLIGVVIMEIIIEELCFWANDSGKSSKWISSKCSPLPMISLGKELECLL